MSENDRISTADAADRHRQRISLAMLAMSFMYLAKAGRHLAGPDLRDYLGYFIASMAIFAVVLVVSVVYWKLRRLPAGERHLYFGADGFVVDALHRAYQMSWAATFLLLLGFEIVVSDDDFTVNLPGEFFLQVAIGVMLCVSSSVFFYLTRDERDRELETESRA